MCMDCHVLESKKALAKICTWYSEDEMLGLLDIKLCREKNKSLRTLVNDKLLIVEIRERLIDGDEDVDVYKQEASFMSDD